MIIIIILVHNNSNANNKHDNSNNANDKDGDNKTLRCTCQPYNDTPILQALMCCYFEVEHRTHFRTLSRFAMLTLNNAIVFGKLSRFAVSALK